MKIIANLRVYAYFPEKREIMATAGYDYGKPIEPFKVVFSYNEREQLIKHVHYESDGSQINVTSYEYDTYGNIKEEISGGRFNETHPTFINLISKVIGLNVRIIRFGAIRTARRE